MVMMNYSIDQECPPLEFFRQWYDQAAGRSRGSQFSDQLLFPLRKLMRTLYPPLSLHEGDAVVLATATATGRPSARVVLFKGIWQDGVVFYTNYQSRKVTELESNPQAALVFHWALPERQVRFEGRVEKVPPEISDEYWRTRPRGSQVGAWASDQSRSVKSRDELLQRVRDVEQRFGQGPIPRPPHWGGMVLKPDAIEFWEACAFRLHKRRRYERQASGWQSTLLCP